MSNGNTLKAFQAIAALQKAGNAQQNPAVTADALPRSVSIEPGFR